MKVYHINISQYVKIIVHLEREGYSKQGSESTEIRVVIVEDCTYEIMTADKGNICIISMK